MQGLPSRVKETYGCTLKFTSNIFETSGSFSAWPPPGLCPGYIRGHHKPPPSPPSPQIKDPAEIEDPTEIGIPKKSLDTSL